MPGEHAFVDESKRDVYLVVAVVAAPADLATSRAALKALRPTRTRRIHFQAESDSRRRKFLDVASSLPVSAMIYTVRGHRELEARRMILTRLVGDLVDRGAVRLVLERDDSMVVHDERAIKEERARLGAQDRLRFDLVSLNLLGQVS